MNCKTCKKYHSDYIDGMLEKRLAEEVKAHVATCLKCLTHLHAITRVVLQLRTTALNSQKNSLSQ